MRKNYFAKLVKYIKDVYHIERGLNQLTDGRVDPTYSTAQVITPLLFGFLLRIKSMNELNCMLKEGEFRKLFNRGTKLPLVDTMRDTVKVIDRIGLHNILKSTIKKAIENKVFKNGTIDGYTVVAIDGTKFFGSYVKCCSQCLSTIIKGETHYYHSGAVMSTIGDGPKLVLDFEMYSPKIDSSKKDEGEINVAKRLMTRALETHKSFVDVVVYDALVCNSSWFNHCIDGEVDTIVRMKNNNNKSLRKVKSLANKSEPVAVWEQDKAKIDVSEKNFTMSGVERPLRFVKFAIKYPNKKRTQIMIVTTCMDLSLETIFKMIKARWNIENCIFNYLKQEAGLGHCFVHGGNAVEAILYLIFIAANLFQLFKARRIKNQVPIQRELVRLVDLKNLTTRRKGKRSAMDDQSWPSALTLHGKFWRGNHVSRRSKHRFVV